MNVGDAHVEVDVKAIEQTGYNTVIMIIVTNTFDYLDVVSVTIEGEIFEKEQLLSAIS